MSATTITATQLWRMSATDLAGMPTTLGLRALAGAVPRLDAPAVERLRTAGAIPLGRTNCPTLTLRWLPTPRCRERP